MDVFRRGKALILCLLQPSLPSPWFAGTAGVAVLQSPVTLTLLQGGMGSFPAH